MTEINYYSEDEINCKGKICNAGFIDDSLLRILADALTRAPAEIVDKALSNCTFFRMDPIKAAGTFIPKSIHQGKNIIFLSQGLFDVSIDCRRKIILHEIAHYILHHKTWADESAQGKINAMTFTKIKEDMQNQEKEADKLRDKWLADYSKSHEGGAL